MHIIKQYLAKENMTAKDYARVLGITTKHLSFIMNGKSYPSPELANKMKATSKEFITHDSLYQAQKSA